MAAPNLYAYDPVTGEYRGPATADPSPREEGVWLHPAYTTETPPPEAAEGHVPVWRGIAWDVVPDHRGEIWYRDGEPVVITEPGNPAGVGLDPEAPVPPEPTLDEVKAGAKARIDREAEAARQRFITPGSGQMAAYLAKEAEAEAFLGDGDPKPADYPFLAASLGVDGDTLADVVNTVRANAVAWRTIGAAIEKLRLNAKAAVAAAATREAAEAAAVVPWPAPAPAV